MILHYCLAYGFVISKKFPMAKISFLGATQTTTGSRHLLEICGRKILLDCGLFQGRREESYQKNRHFGFNPSEIDAVIISHAHIDHSGALPCLCKQGFEGNVYVTPATRDLCQLMLVDSAHVQAAEIEYINKRRHNTGLPPAEVLYSPQEAERSVRQMITVAYNRTVTIAENIQLTFAPAGHILGAAQCVIDFVENGKKRRLLFSGDIGRSEDSLLNPPETVSDVDIFILESTYGGREHPPSEDATQALCQIVNAAVEQLGKVIIPAFAVERTQLILYHLHKNISCGCLPSLPIYVDSPLAVDATGVFRLHPDAFRQEIYRQLFERENLFGFDQLYFTRQSSQSKELNNKPGPMVIISASGMCEGGRVLHHLRNNISNPTTTVLFVGYCAEHTLGAKLLAGAKVVNIFGEPFTVRAKIAQLGYFSGHADRHELLSYFKNTTGNKKHTFLVHGEPGQSAALAEAIRASSTSSEICIPQFGQSFVV